LCNKKSKLLREKIVMYSIAKSALLIFILGVFFKSPNLLAQESQSHQRKAIYLVSRNISNRVPRVYDGELIFDDKSSVFTYAKDLPDKGEERKYDGEQNRMVISKGSGTDAIGSIFYSDFVGGKTVQRTRFQGRSFIISDTLRTPDWTLLDDTKEINGMKCQKATAAVHGREYETWFSTDIPLPYGPWKLHGLPGLILEAHSTDGEISFEFSEIQPMLSGHHEIVPPSIGHKIEGYANFFELQDKKAEEIFKAAQAQFAEHQQSIETNSTTTIAIKRPSGGVSRIEKTPTF